CKTRFERERIGCRELSSLRTLQFLDEDVLVERLGLADRAAAVAHASPWSRASSRAKPSRSRCRRKRWFRPPKRAFGPGGAVIMTTPRGRLAALYELFPAHNRPHACKQRFAQRRIPVSAG